MSQCLRFTLYATCQTQATFCVLVVRYRASLKRKNIFFVIKVPGSFHLRFYKEKCLKLNRKKKKGKMHGGQRESGFENAAARRENNYKPGRCYAP